MVVPIHTNMAAPPTTGECKVAMVLHIDKGCFGEIAIEGLSFVIIVLTPGAMGEGNWKVGLIIDDGASED